MKFKAGYLISHIYYVTEVELIVECRHDLYYNFQDKTALPQEVVDEYYEIYTNIFGVGDEV